MKSIIKHGLIFHYPMGQLYDGDIILYITAEKYLSLGTGTIEDEQKS